ncbi:GNAT family N-acetyltransferase [Kineosporia babensis]|uniref:GNAT family N-acetyltransferase n=1 Tax=Kineosporia babensis TaxID=499548 RepID=A0A9X1NIN6_9ACTN|nr:GNAT family N-acetyltransferase [Kineosporia babensis]MCD5314858.1 GNAT family N-acetyltransferase [Kineosporia babensis]
MVWQTERPVTELVGAAGELWAAEPAVNTMLLSLTGGSAPHTGGWWRAPDGSVAGSYLHSTIGMLLLGSMPPRSASVLAERLAGDRKPLSARGVQGPRALVEEFVAVWEARTGARAAATMDQALHRLGTLIGPEPGPEGWARTAGPGDRDRLLGWFTAFGEETGAIVDLPAAVDARLATGLLTIWEHQGRPVSLAGSTVPARGSSRITSVYTPPPLRGNSFAAGAVSASVRQAQAQGADSVVLFTDMANPTSNALYRRLGFERITDFRQVLYATT